MKHLLSNFCILKNTNMFCALSCKAVNKGISVGSELSEFSDTPDDASLEDLFYPLDKGTEARAKTSDSASTSHVSPSAAAPKPGNLATRLRDAIAQKKMGNGMGQANGGSLLRVMINALKEDVTDMDSNLVHFILCSMLSPPPFFFHYCRSQLTSYVFEFVQ